MSGVKALWLAKYKQTWYSGPHKHDFFQLFFPLTGSGTAVYENQSHTFSGSGELYLVPPGLMHGFNNFDNKIGADADSDFTAFDCKFVVEDADIKAMLLSMPIRIRLENARFYTSLCDSMLAESQKRPALYQTVVDANLSTLLVNLIRQFAPKEACKALDAKEMFIVPENDSRICGTSICKLMRFIDDKYNSIINLDDLARIAGVNKTTLIYIFKQLYGITPMRYVSLRRMARAKELLCLTDKSISEISNEVGYQSIHYFSKAFKDKEGCSPFEYRMYQKDNCYMLLSDQMKLD